jgi:Trm5-related predicted tRNA methylase
MPLLPSNPDDLEANEDASIKLSGIEVTNGDREQILEALKLNRHILHEPQPDAEVDEAAVRKTIDALLDQLTEVS